MVYFRHSTEIGGIEIICGPMFSGKTEELIRRVRLALIAKQRIQLFKPVIDNRYDTEYITSHIDQKFFCTPISEAKEIFKHLEDNTRVVGIDEAQFFKTDLVETCEKLANRGLRVIVSGLDQDYLGNPFGQIPNLLATADDVVKLKAVCMVCGGSATKSQRLTEETDQVVVGAGEHYEARCRFCFDPHLSFEKSVLKTRAKKGKEGSKVVPKGANERDGKTPSRTAS